MITDRRILALDLGTLLGWAAWDPYAAAERAYAHGRITLTGDHGPRFNGGRRAIDKLVRDHLPTGRGLLVIEAPACRHRNAQQIMFGLRSIAMLAACDRGFDVLEVMPAEIKQLATGKGNASKAPVLAAARAKWGAGVETEDEADALWALEWARLNASVTEDQPEE